MDAQLDLPERTHTDILQELEFLDAGEVPLGDNFDTVHSFLILLFLNPDPQL